MLILLAAHFRNYVAGINLFDYVTLVKMIDVTYALWVQVLEEREAELRRGAGGKPGPLI